MTPSSLLRTYVGRENPLIVSLPYLSPRDKASIDADFKRNSNIVEICVCDDVILSKANAASCFVVTSCLFLVPLFLLVCFLPSILGLALGGPREISGLASSCTWSSQCWTVARNLASLHQ